MKNNNRYLFLLLLFFSALLLHKKIAVKLNYNILLIKVEKSNPEWLWGIGPLLVVDDFEDIRNYGEYRFEAPNPALISLDYSQNILTMVQNLNSITGEGLLTTRQLRTLGRLNNFAHLWGEALDIFRDLERNIGCERKNIEYKCTFLYVDIGDALAAIGARERALSYYREANWFRRKEAGVALLLRKLDTSANEVEHKQIIREAENLLPGSLLVTYESYISTSQGGEEYLRISGDPRIVLPTYRDTRLSSRQADLIAYFYRDGILDRDDLKRVLNFRAWQVDLHDFDYQNYVVRSKGWMKWQVNSNSDWLTISALVEFFSRINELIPDEVIVQNARSEFLRRANQQLVYNNLEQTIPDDRKRRGSPVENCPNSVLMEPLGDRGILYSDFSQWWLGGQAIDLFSTVPKGWEGSAGWAVGPDTYNPFCSQPSYRVQCVWQDENAVSSPMLNLYPKYSDTNEFATFLNLGSDELQIDLWWQSNDDSEISFLGEVDSLKFENLGMEDGWHHYRWYLHSSQMDRMIAWSMQGCSSTWIGSFTIARSSFE